METNNNVAIAATQPPSPPSFLLNLKPEVIIKPETLVRWPEMSTANCQQQLETSKMTVINMEEKKKDVATTPPTTSHSPFYDDSINQKIILWNGDLMTLQVDVIVKFLLLTDHDDGAKGVNQQQQQPPEIGTCQVIDNNMTCQKSKQLSCHCHYVIETVLPNMEKIKIDTDLVSKCYENILQMAHQLGCHSIAIPVNVNLSSTSSNLNCLETLTHIALCTVRRYLDQHGNQFDSVIFVISNNKNNDGNNAKNNSDDSVVTLWKIYTDLLPIYFPRSKCEEEECQIKNLTDDTSLTDPQIRIIDNPQQQQQQQRHHSVLRQKSDRKDDVTEINTNTTSSSAAAASAVISSTTCQQHFDISSLDFDSSFAQMRIDPDRQRLLDYQNLGGGVSGGAEGGGMNDPITSLILQELEHQERYEKLLRQSKTEDLSEVSGIGCLYQSGHDRLGRPVVIFIGKWFPYNKINLDKAMLYLINLLDPIVRGDYVIAYFHTLTSNQNYPALSWLREIYQILPYKYKKNLKAFYVIHPTFWTKMMTWWFTTFMAPAIKQKVHNLPGVEYLYSVMSPDQLEIPAFCTEYDMSVNGLRYFHHVSSTTTQNGGGASANKLT